MQRGVDLTDSNDQPAPGPWLEWDEAHERFKDNAKANELVRGFYRKPFDVPEVKV